MLKSFCHCRGILWLQRLPGINCSCFAHDLVHHVRHDCLGDQKQRFEVLVGVGYCIFLHVLTFAVFSLVEDGAPHFGNAKQQLHLVCPSEVVSCMKLVDAALVVVLRPVHKRGIRYHVRIGML